MDKKQLQRAIYSILIGAAIMALNQIVGVLLEYIKNHSIELIAPVVSILHFLNSTNTSGRV